MEGQKASLKPQPQLILENLDLRSMASDLEALKTKGAKPAPNRPDFQNRPKAAPPADLPVIPAPRVPAPQAPAQRIQAPQAPAPQAPAPRPAIAPQTASPAPPRLEPKEPPLPKQATPAEKTFAEREQRLQAITTELLAATKKKEPEKDLQLKTKPVARKFDLKIIAMALAGVVIVAFGLFMILSKPEEEPLPTPVEPAIKEPLPLFQTDDKTVISLDNKDLGAEIKKAAQRPLPPGRFKHLVLKKNNVYPDLDKALGELKIQLPADMPLSGINADNYTLFLYYQRLENTSSSTARLGLVARAQDAVSLKQYLKNKETDLAGIFGPMLMTTTATSSSSPFSDNTYRNTAIRYINFPNSDLTIDYAVWDDWLLVTTSKESAYAVLDKMITGF
jgi:hypothetical protein